MDSLEKRVLSNLIALRKAAGFSQKQVEQRLNLRGNTLYDYEKGRLKLPFVAAVELTELYHSDVSALVRVPDDDLNENEELASSLATPLVSLGVISGEHPLASTMAQDPVIIAEVGVGQLGKKPLMALLLDNLTATQQQHFVMDLYRYINSLISRDGEIRQTELNIRDTLIAQAQVELSERDKKSIARAFTKPFFGKSTVKSMPREAHRHFLIWLLHLVARIDSPAHFKQTEYIHQVAEHIELPISSVRFIEEQVQAAYQD